MSPMPTPTPPQAPPRRININIKVGVVMPSSVDSNIHTFNICQYKECVEGGIVSTFGKSVQDPNTKEVSKKRNTFRYHYITRLVSSLEWADMTSFLVKGMPKPVVIVEDKDRKTSNVTLAPEAQRQDYGDLLDKFTSVNIMESVKP